MLLIALLAGAIFTRYFRDWRDTPPGPRGRLVFAECSLCHERMAADGGPPIVEMMHHLRLFHPDSYDELMESMGRQ